MERLQCAVVLVRVGMAFLEVAREACPPLGSDIEVQRSFVLGEDKPEQPGRLSRTEVSVGLLALCGLSLKSEAVGGEELFEAGPGATAFGRTLAWYVEVVALPVQGWIGAILEVLPVQDLGADGIERERGEGVALTQPYCLSCAIGAMEDRADQVQQARV
jgi:hypothetical protein